MRTLICTTGTSIAINAKINLDRLKRGSGNTPDKSEIQSIKKAISRKIENLSTPEDLKGVSAELKSLVKMGVDKTDTVVLISSDTVDGFLCAELLREIIQDRFGCQVEISKIEGLQADDGDLFRRKGLKNLFNELFNRLEGHQYEEIILNPTGGYKSVVPYLTIFGMIFNKPVQYIHEESEDVITLSGIPLIQDESLMFRVEDKLKKIYREGTIARKEWNLGIDYNDQRYDSLIEEDDGLVIMSGVGMVLYERFRKDYPEDIERDPTPPEQKENKLLHIGINHHGSQNLISISKRLLQSPYVKKTINSCENQPQSKIPVKPLSRLEASKHIQQEEIGVCIVTNIKSDEGFSFLIKTTARDDAENERIAELLNQRYFS